MKAITTLLCCIICSITFETNAQKSQSMASRIQAMSKEKNPEKNELSMHQIIKDFKLDTVKNAEDLDVLKGQVALAFLNVYDFQKFETYIGLIKNKFNQTSYLNMAADLLFKSGLHLDYAEIIAQKTVQSYDSYKNDPLAKPNDFPLEDWNRFMKMASYPYYDSYAKILHANGKDQQALIYQEKALKDLDLEQVDQSAVELYSALMAKNNQTEKAYETLLKMAKIGKSNANMDLLLQELLLKKGKTEAEATLFLDSTRKQVKETYQTEVAKKMIKNVEAPDFSLLDLNGKNVKLSAFSGKIVVLDFWATWCAPCIASMPAMKRISALHPEVVFLFIATQEQGTDATKRVKAFVDKNKFPKTTLLDRSVAGNPKIFSTANAYKLEGIPAKIVIDKNGKLRFSTSGFISESELTNELEAMITIVKAQ